MLFFFKLYYVIFSKSNITTYYYVVIYTVGLSLFYIITNKILLIITITNITIDWKQNCILFLLLFLSLMGVVFRLLVNISIFFISFFPQKYILFIGETEPEFQQSSSTSSQTHHHNNQNFRRILWRDANRGLAVAGLLISGALFIIQGLP